jgi:hypothetical protein
MTETETKIVNLTPHEITIVGENGEVTHRIPPSGLVSRVRETSIGIRHVNGIPVVRKTFGEVVNLPEPEEGTVYIVSRMIIAASPDRTDLLSPGDLVRDDVGKIIGCKNFAE